MIKNFIKPDTIEQAVELVQPEKNRALYFGNGVFINKPSLKYSLHYDTAVSLQNLGLNSVKSWTVNGRKGIKLGSMLTLQAIIDHPDPKIPDILKQAAMHEYSRPMRNMKTLGGDISANIYTSHLSPVLAALSAMVEIDGEEWMTFISYKKDLKQELITNIFIPDLKVKCSLKRLSLNTHMPAILSVAASREDGSDEILTAIAGIGNLILTNTIYQSNLDKEKDKTAYIEKFFTENLRPVHDRELHGSDEYVKYLTGVAAADCIKALWD